MISLFGIIGVIFFFTVLFKVSKRRSTWKGKNTKIFNAYSLLIAGYAVYIFIDSFFLKTRFHDSGLSTSIFMYLLAFYFLWSYKLGAPKET